MPDTDALAKRLLVWADFAATNGWSQTLDDLLREAAAALSAAQEEAMELRKVCQVARDWFAIASTGEEGVNWLNGDSHIYAGCGSDQEEEMCDLLEAALGERADLRKLAKQPNYTRALAAGQGGEK